MDPNPNQVSGNGSGHNLRFGCFRLDGDHKVLWRGGQALPLGPKVVHTLAALVAHRGEIVSKEELIREVWGDTAVDDNSVAQNIYILRKTLNGDLSNSFTLETIPRRGYRFCAAAGVISSRVDSAASLPSPEVPAAPSKEVPQRPWLWFTAIFLGVLSIVGISLSAPRFLRKGHTRQSVAVIGFVNLSRQAENAWLSPALTEMMTTELASGGNLLTVPDENVVRARVELKLEGEEGFSNETLAQLWRNLGADVVVSGAYAVMAPKPGARDQLPQTDNGRVRLDLRVQNARTGELLDSTSVIGEQSNLFELVALAGQHVRQDLGVAVPAPEEARQTRASVSSNPQAVRFYAEGVEKLRRFDALGARELLQQSVQLDPKYALAHTALAEALDVLGHDQASIDEAKLAFELSGNLSPQERLSIEGRYWEATRNGKKAVDAYSKLVNSSPDNEDYGLNLASAQIAASDANGAFSTLNSLRHLPGRESGDPRISLKEYEVWKSLGDYKRAESSLVEAEESARRQGALLLLAQARVDQCWIRLKLSKKQEAMADCQEAHQIYATAADRRGEAEALRLLGRLVSGSDVLRAMNYYHESLKIEQEIGHLEGQAAAMNQLARLYSDQGDHVAAKNSYEQALELFRELDAKPDSIGLLINVGIESAALGETEQARKMYQQALALGVEVDNKDIEGFAEQNIGQLEQTQGDVAAAKKSYERALRWFRQAGDQAQVAATMNFLGEVTMARGDLDSARKLFQQALSIHEPMPAVQSEMDIADLSLVDERACPAELKASVGRVREAFRKAGSVDGEAQALTLLARCLLADGQAHAALDAIEEAREIANKSEPDVRLLVTVLADRVRFASQGREGTAPIVGDLKRTIAEAHKSGYVSVELDARLALGEIEVRSGASARGRRDLRAVERDAARRGLALLARKARAAA